MINYAKRTCTEESNVKTVIVIGIIWFYKKNA